SLQAPAICPGVVTIGGIDQDLKPWAGTNPGYYLAFAAPAVHVGSIGKDGTFSADNNGTSQAAALTSANIALVRSRFPKMPGREVIRELTNTANKLYSGYDARTGWGIIRTNLIFAGKVPPTGPNPVYERYDHWLASGAKEAMPEQTSVT